MNIVENPKIHKELLKRWKELDLTAAAIIEDAEERGIHISPPRISKYKSAIKYGKNWKVKSIGSFKESFTSNQLLFLCYRYGIYVHINVGSPVIEGGKLKYEVMPFSEIDCLRKLYQVFPDLKIAVKDLKNGE